MAVPNFVELEQDILKRWKDEDVFRATLKKDAPQGKFVFFEGPPTANGKPHMGHVETRAFKDLFPRFKTMQGYRVDRKAGWDTQGLPVELEVEKAIGVSGKQDIEKYGIEKFNEQCRTSVWKYKELWEQMTDRVGFWLDLEQPYVTYENSYIETLWWILKQAWDAGLLVQDYKVVPYCPRCGTALSSHEVAQGYEFVKDRSVYVKFELVDEPGTFVLAWTTTPWTLPGNVALAVSEKIRYIKTAKNEKGERYILAEELFNRVIGPEGVSLTQGSSAQIISGKDLIGKSYKPLFDFLDLEKETGKKAYYIAAADFVTTDDGTGVVHTAVMYGEDDFQLGSKLDLPKKHTVDLEGKFNELVKPWAGLEVRDPKGETQHQIITWLKEHGKLYKEEKYEHDYPFCWRCKHPLLYYAKTSWFITMSKLRDELIANNAEINWVPNHIKDGRFGEWLREVKDWAISRERYWGTPLPIWRCENCGHDECVGSYQELIEKIPSRNRFIFVRHGESTNSKAVTINTDPKNNHVELTTKGRKQAEAAAKRLAKEKIDAIYVSEFKRTQQTAEPMAKVFGLTPMVEPRINEYRIASEWEGKGWADFHRAIGGTAKTVTERNELNETYLHFHHREPGCENWSDVRVRMLDFLLELDRTNEGKTFVIVSHADPIFVTRWALSLGSETQVDGTHFPELGEVVEVKVPSGLYRDNGSFDPHRPYIDSVTWTCSSCTKGALRRVPEVADTWFDSGSMPLAQWHYPFENKAKLDAGEAYPAQFISEAIDQTRGWFYTLLAVSTILQKAKKLKAGPPYETCVVLGHIRDKHGKKLSKSAGNYIDPMQLIEKYGADAVRMYLYTINQPSEPKNFDEVQLSDVVKKTFIILWNVVSFWKLYASGPASAERPTSRDAMDRWILAKLDVLVRDVTNELETYDVVNAARQLTAFVTDLSTWYVRRSRDRAKGDGRSDVVATLGYVLRELAKLMAPFTPFVADALWRELGEASSVHLADWPEKRKIDENILRDMRHVREVVEAGHALRAQAKIKVRQPLSQVIVRRELLPELDDVVREELNVKEVVTDGNFRFDDSPNFFADPDAGVVLNIEVTDALREEGYLREMVRAINALRKALKLKPGERIALVYAADDATAKYVEHFSAVLKEKGNVLTLVRNTRVESEPSATAELDGVAVVFGRGA